MSQNSTDNIDITRMTVENYRDAFSLACEIFAEASVLHKAVSISIDEYRDYMRTPFEAMWQQGLSLVATDRQSNEIIGCLIACDYDTQAQNSVDVPQSLKPVNALLKALDVSYRKHRRILPGECMLADMAVVKPAFGGRGIYRRLREKSHDIGREAGFGWVVGELSAAATQHLCVNGFGHKVCAEIEYESFEYGKQKPFASIKEPKSILLVEGQLT